jgi:hypothetical protein
VVDRPARTQCQGAPAGTPGSASPALHGDDCMARDVLATRLTTVAHPLHAVALTIHAITTADIDRLALLRAIDIDENAPTVKVHDSAAHRRCRLHPLPTFRSASSCSVLWEVLRDADLGLRVVRHRVQAGDLVLRPPANEGLVAPSHTRLSPVDPGAREGGDRGRVPGRGEVEQCLGPDALRGNEDGVQSRLGSIGRLILRNRQCDLA